MARILIVDDDELVRKTVREILERADYEVEEAHDGEAGLKQAVLSKPDLIVTDILMPNQDGIELILQLRRVRPEAKILAMSGGGKFDNDRLLTMAKVLGADECLAKPFGKASLLDKVAACLG